MGTGDICHVCIVEDDGELRGLLSDYLESHGLRTRAVASAEELLQGRAAGARSEVIVMDIGLPGLSGLQACQQLRRRGDRVPIILLTAHNDDADRVLGLEMGADDYVGKPYSARELLARVRAALRRTEPPAGALSVPRSAVTIGEHTFLPDLRRVSRGSELRVLNAIEFALLSELTSHPDVAIARERLLAVSHMGQGQVLIRAVDAAIMRLRKMLEPDPSNPRYILTVRFQGYMFVPHGAPPA